VTAVETAQRLAVISEARSWVGTRWHHAARVKGAGVDCAQLLVAVYEACGVTQVTTPPSYPRDWAQHRSEELLLQHLERYARCVEVPQAGDAVAFKFGQCVSHLGIVVAWPTIIHAYLGARQVVEDDVQRNVGLAQALVGFWSPWRL
jgi:NlpC/P60 family putative phage cell wall peptidase